MRQSLNNLPKYMQFVTELEFGSRKSGSRVHGLNSQPLLMASTLQAPVGWWKGGKDNSLGDSEKSHSEAQQ